MNILTLQNCFFHDKILIMNRKISYIPNFYSSFRIYYLHSYSLLYERWPTGPLYCKRSTVTESNPYLRPCISPHKNVHVLTAMNSTHLNNPNQNLYIILFTLKTGSKLVAEEGWRNYARQTEGWYVSKIFPLPPSAILGKEEKKEHRC